MRKKLVVIFLIVPFFHLFSGEYTNQFRIKVDSQGESETGNPVEAFNSAINYATQSAEAQGAGVLKGYSESKDSVLNSLWIKKESHLQVVDLKVLDYKFLTPDMMSQQENKRLGAQYNRYLFTNMKIDVTMEYLDVPTFIEDYQKTVQGASYRAMAFPGWGQVYNKQYTTGFLYAASFWTLYTMFAVRSSNAGGNNTELDSAFLNLQIPSMILWAFNVSDAATSRVLGRIGLNNLANAYRLDNLDRRPESKVERGFKMDLILFEIPLYKLWKD